MKKGLITFCNGLGQIIAFITVLLWLALLVNTAVISFTGNGFIPTDFLGIAEYIKYWATLLALALSGMELALKNIFLTLIYIIAVAGCVVLMFVGAETIMNMLSGIMA